MPVLYYYLNYLDAIGHSCASIDLYKVGPEVTFG